MKPKKDNNEREFFRISYRRAQGQGPIFDHEKTKYPILDLSEGGLKFITKRGATLFADNDIIEGRLVFPLERGTLVVKGKIIRVTPTDVAVRLTDDTRIPLARIMEEQRLLIQQGRL